MPEEPLTVRPWKPYGKDRLYVNDADGRSLGYLDRLTDTVHVNDDVDRPAVLEALGRNIPEQRLPAQVQAPYAVTIDRLAMDLVQNQPGASARQGGGASKRGSDSDAARPHPRRAQRRASVAHRREG